MEEPALYRAILDAPHDDTARLVYADWLDEFAATLPEPHARLEHGRAELIRVQCRIARLGPSGWGRNREVPVPAELLGRQKRLRFLYSEKLRRGLPPPLAGHPFDRGFFRPLRHLRPCQFLRDHTAVPEVTGHIPATYEAVPELPAEHPMRRYVASDDPFDAFPLWDIHLYAWAEGGYLFDPWADFGQYGELLVRCARSPALARVGQLKLSFFRTSVAEFLRLGNFVNVETLVLNCAGFPEVLEAVAENESFRSLRYVEFGSDEWAWCVTPAARERFDELAPKLAELNGRHLPHGEMRPALRAVLGGLEPIPVVRLPLRMPDWARLPESSSAPRRSEPRRDEQSQQRPWSPRDFFATGIVIFILVGLVLLFVLR
ncbi:TIGR02996 domain-containing protein [Gemmata sp. JC717]|uniref:TIGR02996 domain-containing protein n=1 Tax=Gemmata algarum TaxID=2975278 RepID=UPI0021BB17F2|nr:TIGR02996 domain-containing protein [Gemmata algarum]MDY3551064.1 TIGR02996 domain-containing protein [Gemmata algarum]